jgi:hypothetical protein
LKRVLKNQVEQNKVNKLDEPVLNLHATYL